MNNIPVLQNEEQQLKLLRARKQTYDYAKLIMVVQMLLALALPIGGAIWGVYRPDIKAYVAAFALVAVVVDPLVLDRWFKDLLRQAAKLGEQFDCAVLDLPWDDFIVGDKVEPEEIHAAARMYARFHDDTGNKDWYPVAAGRAPMHLARIICQRTNLHYDSRLRRSYGTIIKLTALTLVTALFFVGLARNSTLTDWVLTMAPTTTFLTWAAREYYRQGDAADLLEALRKQARALWNSALAGDCRQDECREKAREFQNTIYRHRVGSPLVLPFLYRFKRLSLEDEMNSAAEDFLSEYERSL